MVFHTVASNRLYVIYDRTCLSALRMTLPARTIYHLPSCVLVDVLDVLQMMQYKTESYSDDLFRIVFR